MRLPGSRPIHKRQGQFYVLRKGTKIMTAEFAMVKDPRINFFQAAKRVILLKRCL